MLILGFSVSVVLLDFMFSVSISKFSIRNAHIDEECSC